MLKVQDFVGGSCAQKSAAAVSGRRFQVKRKGSFTSCRQQKNRHIDRQQNAAVQSRGSTGIQGIDFYAQSDEVVFVSYHVGKANKRETQHHRGGTHQVNSKTNLILS